MKYELIIVPGSDDQRLVEDITNFDEMKRAAGSLDSYRHYVFNTEEERKAFLMGFHAMKGWLGDGVYATNDTETQSFRYTWRHEVYIDAIDKDHAEEIWGSLDLGELNKHANEGYISYHEFVEVHSVEDENNNDLLNQ